MVGLPRETFKGTGTTAKTAILYLEKRKPPAEHQVMLVEVGEIDLDGGASSISLMRKGRLGRSKLRWGKNTDERD